MKKQLLAMAVAATFMAGASAAQLDIYGGMDGGLAFTNAKRTFTNTKTPAYSYEEKVKALSMENGMSSPSRLGFKGSEDLGNGYSVSFKLEGAVGMDTGTGGDFRRESRLTVGTPFGEFSFGRMGALSSSAGTYDLFAANATVYDGGWSAAIACSDLFYGDFGRMDNTITYMTPTANGFTGYLQYSNKVTDSHTGTESQSNTPRYVGAGVSFANGPLTIVATAEMNMDVDEASKLANGKDTKCFSLGGNYAFPNGTRVYLAAQYGVNTLSWAYNDYRHDEVEIAPGLKYTIDDTGSDTWFTGANGYNLAAGAVVPCGGGVIKGAVNVTQLKEKNASKGVITTGSGGWASKSKLSQLGVALTYEYDFSKRTTAYCGAGYNKATYKNDGTSFAKAETVQGVVGMRHTF